MVDNKTYKIVQHIESEHKIRLMNLMDDKKTILMSHDRYNEKLTLVNNKLILENFLIKNIYIDKPEIIINYQGDYALTNMYNIGFTRKKYFNIFDLAYELHDRYPGGHKARIINLFKYKDDIFVIFIFFCSNHHLEYVDKSIKLGSYKKQLSFEQFLDLV